MKQTMREVDNALGGFIRGQFVVGLILTTLYTLGFWIVGAPYPMLLGIVSGIGNFIPYAGTMFGMALAVLLNVLQGESITTIALTMVVFGVVQALEAWVITPRIVGRRVGLSPLAVLLAVLLFAGSSACSWQYRPRRSFNPRKHLAAQLPAVALLSDPK